MGLLKSMREVLSGRRLHKNRTNNVVVATLWRRCAALSYHNELFRDLVVAASAISEEFLFGDERPREIVAKDYTLRQFELFYDTVITFLTFAASISDPAQAPSIKRALVELASDWDSARPLMERLEVHATIDRAAMGIVYSHVMAVAKIGTPAIAPFVKFTVLCLVACGRHDEAPV